MREQYFRTPPVRLKNGLPPTPSFLLVGAELISVADARIVSVEHQAGKGTVAVHLVSATDECVLETKPAENAEVERAKLPGVTFFMTAGDALAIANAMVGKERGDRARLAPKPESTPLDIDHVSFFRIIRIAADDSAFLYHRSQTRPFAIRIAFSKEDADLYGDLVREAAGQIPPGEWDAFIEALDVEYTVGPHPEVSEKPRKMPAPTPPVFEPLKP